MSEDKFSLSRRKALAALGTIGVASAGAGLGTSAYFSDQETFENNSLTAGTLDLGVGYSVHYSNWMPNESGLAEDANGVTVNMYDGPAGTTGTASELSDDFTGLPANDAWLIEVDDPDQFLDNTQTSELTNAGCDDEGVGALTNADGESALVSLDDVKPGDFGEVTFDLELCTNPGYVWMNNPGGYTAAENGTTEPEADDPDEGEGVELMDVVQAAVWLDDGDNYQDGGESPLLSGSLGSVLDALNSGNGVRIDGTNVPAADVTPADFTRTGVTRIDFNGDGNYDSDVELAADPAGGGGKVAHATSDGTATADYVTTGVSLDPAPTLGDLTDDPSNPTTTLTYEYYGGANNGNSAPDEVYLLIEEADGTRNVVYHTSNDGAPTGQTWEVRNVHREIAGNPDPEDNPNYNWFEIGGGSLGSADGTDLSDVYGDDAVVLAMAAGRGTTGGGDVLDTYYRNPQVGGESAGSFPTSCFRGETDFSAAFAWWVPVDHGNEIQSDSVEFDLGFYTEQCRHNDGEGMARLEGTTGSGDFSETSYQKALGTQIAGEGGSSRGEIQVHTDAGGVEDTNVFGNGSMPTDTDIPFTVELDPNAETASITVNGVTVTDDDVTDGDANGVSTGDSEYPSGVPSEVDVAINAYSGPTAITTVVKDVTISGSGIMPDNISSQSGNSYLEVTDVSATGPVTVEGTIRFEGSEADYTTSDWVGVDFR